MQGIKEANRTG